MRFSLIIPCYNESKSIPLLLERCKRVTEGCPESEVILVDNGSTDSTPEILRELLPSYPDCRSIRVEKNQGYGFGILSGLRNAKGNVLAWTHADLQTDPGDFLRGIEFFDNKSNDDLFVKGARYGRPMADVVFTWGMSVFDTLNNGKIFIFRKLQPESTLNKRT